MGDVNLYKYEVYKLKITQQTMVYITNNFIGNIMVFCLLVLVLSLANLRINLRAKGTDGNLFVVDGASDKTNCDLRTKLKTNADFDPFHFQNKHDFTFAEKFKVLLNELGYCNRCANKTIFIGGLNEGQLASTYLNSCKGLGLVGVEIQQDVFERVKNLLKDYEGVMILNCGIGDVQDSFLVRGNGEGAFLQQPDGEVKRFANSQLSSKKIDVLPLAMIEKETSFLYVVIDTEGYEPFVLMGMGLQHESNRKRFPMFQFEIGGTWAVADDRHAKGSMSIEEIFAWLLKRGYLLYLMGEYGLYQIDENFYHNAPKGNEGYGEYISGNVLAVFPEYIDQPIQCFIKQIVIT